MFFLIPPIVLILILLLSLADRITRYKTLKKERKYPTGSGIEVIIKELICHKDCIRYKNDNRYDKIKKTGKIFDKIRNHLFTKKIKYAHLREKNTQILFPKDKTEMGTLEIKFEYWPKNK